MERVHNKPWGTWLVLALILGIVVESRIGQFRTNAAVLAQIEAAKVEANEARRAANRAGIMAMLSGQVAGDASEFAQLAAERSRRPRSSSLSFSDPAATDRATRWAAEDAAREAREARQEIEALRRENAFRD